jgi:hypothetical protein
MLVTAGPPLGPYLVIEPLGSGGADHARSNWTQLLK